MNEPISTTQLESSPQELSGKPYSAPAILHELELETRAGSPLAPDEFDPLGLTGLGG